MAWRFCLPRLRRPGRPKGSRAHSWWEEVGVLCATCRLCYEVADVPRTNYDLEHYFGTARHLERRATGRKAASPAMVVRGAVRVVAAVATQL